MYRRQRVVKPHPHRPSRVQRRSNQTAPIKSRRYVYWWIWGKKTGRRIVWGPYTSEVEASMDAAKHALDTFELVPLNTVNEVEASRMLRAKLAHEGEDFEVIFRKFSHQR